MLVVALSCVSGPRPLSPSQLESFSTRRYEGAWEEVFDAAVLSLERLGLSVAEVDQAQGTFVARRADGSGYAVSVQSRAGDQVVIALPTPERPLWLLDGPEGEVTRWDALDERIRALLAAWREFPEWQFLPARNLVAVLQFRAQLPSTWERVEPTIDRRAMLVQRFKHKRGLNPSFLFELSRRRPVLDPKVALVRAAEHAFGAKGRLTWPDDVKVTIDGRGVHGRVELLDGTVPRAATFHLWDQRSSAWAVRVAAICDTKEGCEAEWTAFVESITAPGFEPGRTTF